MWALFRVSCAAPPSPPSGCATFPRERGKEVRFNGADDSQFAHMQALAYTFLTQHLGAADKPAAKDAP